MIDEIVKSINSKFLNRKLLTKENKNKLYYAVKQPDGFIKVVLPFCFENKKFLKLENYKDGIEGATQRVIETIKENVNNFPELAGYFRRRYRELYEPLTVVNCDLNFGANLWRADKYNYIEKDKIFLILRMVFDREERVKERVDEIAEEINKIIENVDINILIDEAKNIIDQKYLRSILKNLGLVSFIANGSRVAREYTEVRKHYRIAGPKKDNIPFYCPEELEPIEIKLRYRKVKGLGIKEKEIFIITGRNAQGKSTLLQAIDSGQDDHLIGDGREFIITTKSLSKASAGTMEMRGEDISLFFEKLPEGIKGEPKSVYGTASGSMTMAYQIQKAIKLKKKLVLIDEDNSAVNLLVEGLLNKKFEGVKPLSYIIRKEREKLGETGFIIVTSSLDLLTALGDRVMIIENHRAYYLNLEEFRKELSNYYKKLAEEIVDDNFNRK
ncbi:P-loop domain-containing protein [Methanocaldococcus infernus]